MLFSDSFCHFLSQHSDDSRYVTNNPQLLRINFRLFVSSKPYEKYNLCEEYCIAYHDDKACSLPACKYHIILLGEIEELQDKLDTFCFTYQHVDCLYTMFKYSSNGKIDAKIGNVFDNVQRAISFYQRNRGMDKMPSIANASSCPVHKTSIEYFRFLYSSVSDRLFAQKNQSTNDQKVQTLHPDTSQRELIEVPTVHLL